MVRKRDIVHRKRNESFSSRIMLNVRVQSEKKRGQL